MLDGVVSLSLSVDSKRELRHQIMRFGICAFMAVGLAFGLVACGDAGESEPNVAVDDVVSEENGESEATMNDEAGEKEENASFVLLPSGWMAEPDVAKVTLSEYISSNSEMGKVSITMIEGIGEDSAETIAMEMQENSGNGATSIREETIGEDKWFVLVNDEDFGGEAFCDQADGDIKKITWENCSFDKAKQVFQEYEEQKTFGSL